MRYTVPPPMPPEQQQAPVGLLAILQHPQIMAHLAGFLPAIDISTSTDHGINADAKEAIAFAVLAHETWRRKPSNLPSATGAKRAVVLGSITP